jgi:O-antigen/teichoic acid export membrane protein
VGLDQVGVFALVWILVLFAQSLHQAAVVSPMLVLGAKTHEKIDQQHYLSGLFALHVIFSFLVALSIGFFMHFYEAMYPEIMLENMGIKLPLLIFLILNNDFFRKWFYIKHKHSVVSVVDALAYGIQLALLIYLGLNDRLTLDSVFTILIITQLLASVICVIIASFEKTSLFQLKLILQMHANYSVWLLLAAVFQWFTGNVLLLVGGKLLTMEVIGALRIMQNLMGVLNVILLSFESYIPISASKIFDHSGFGDLLEYLKTTLIKGMVIFAFPLTVFFFFSSAIISLVYGAEYISFSYLLKGYVFLYVFIIFGMILRIGLRSIELTRPVFISYVLTAGISVALAKPLIMQWGDMGIVIGLVIAQVVMILYYGVLIVRQSRIHHNI